MDRHAVDHRAGYVASAVARLSFGNKPVDLIPVMAKGLAVRGISVGSAAASMNLVGFVAKYRIKPPIAERFAFDAKVAYRLPRPAPLQ